MKVFLAGASGVIGRSLVPLLTRAGYDGSIWTHSDGLIWLHLDHG